MLPTHSTLRSLSRVCLMSAVAGTLLSLACKAQSTSPATDRDDRREIRLTVRLPAGAEPELAGQRMSGTSPVPEFRLPPILTTKDYDYPVVGRWKRGDKRIEVRRTIKVRGGVNQDVDLRRPHNWPAFQYALSGQNVGTKCRDKMSGQNVVRVRNPNADAAYVGLWNKTGRTVSGSDFEVPADSVRSVFVPDGRYELWLHYPDRPDEFFQGDSFVLSRNGVEIQLVRVINGNYGLRRVQ